MKYRKDNFVTRKFRYYKNILKSSLKRPKLAFGYLGNKTSLNISRIFNKLGIIYTPKLKVIVSAKIEITQDCNSKCVTCNFWRINSLMSGLPIDRKKLSYEEYKNLIDQLKNLNCKSVQILGGEPLLNPRAVDLIKYASSKGLDINTVTNGLLLNEETAKKLVDSGLKSLDFSIDAPTKELNDKIRGVDGYYEQQIRAIKQIIKYDKKNKIKKGIGVTVSKLNINEIDQMVDFAKELGINYVNFVFLSVYKKDIKHKTDTIFKQKVGSLEFMVNPDLIPKDTYLIQLKRKQILEKAKKYNIHVGGQLINGELIDIKKGIKREKQFCMTPFKFIVIDCYGYIYPCDMLRFPYGNIRDISIKEGLRGKKFEEFSKIYLEHFKNIPICDHCPLYSMD